MNPYQTPSEDCQIDPEDHRQYRVVHKMVLWGEKREDIYRRMEVNGLTGDGADVLYQCAWRDRLRTIRAVYLRRLVLGIGLGVAGGIVFISFWYGLGFIPRLLLYVCFVSWGMGTWKFVDGMTGYCLAHKKEGSVAEDF